MKNKFLIMFKYIYIYVFISFFNYIQLMIKIFNAIYLINTTFMFIVFSIIDPKISIHIFITSVFNKIYVYTTNFSIKINFSYLTIICLKN